MTRRRSANVNDDKIDLIGFEICQPDLPTTMKRCDQGSRQNSGGGVNLSGDSCRTQTLSSSQRMSLRRGSVQVRGGETH